MKIYVNQCPLCETRFTKIWDYDDYPRTSLCEFCGGVYTTISRGTYRVMTLKELSEACKDYPDPPAHIREAHDRAVADKWG